MSQNLFKKFYIYQKERFPLQVLVFTTLAVVLSSLAVISRSQPLISNYALETLLAFIAGLIFMFHIRVLDERKDLQFDNQHHSDRPIQRGVISLRTLFKIDILLLFILFGISMFSSFYSFFFLLIALIYSFIAGMDFFLGDKIRNKFFLYNFLCLIQLFFFQIHLYALMTPKINFMDSLLYIHFIFVICNAGIIEVGRKIKIKSNEGTGKDTYSSRMGKRNSIWFFLFLIIATFLIFSYLLINITDNLWLLIGGLVSLLIMIFSLIVYLLSENDLSEKCITIAGVIYYLSLHLLIASTMII